MKNILSAALIAFLFFAAAAPAARAEDAPPSEESVRELMGLMQMGKMVDSLLQSIDASTRETVRHAFAGEGLSEKQEKIVSEASAAMVAMLKEEIRPEALEPAYVGIFRRSLTQQEVEGMNAFYKSDAGRALLTKMPVVMRQVSDIMNQRMQKLFPKYQQMQLEMMRRLKEQQ